MALSIGGDVCLRRLLDNLTKCAIADVGIGRIKLRSVKEIEGSQVKNALESFAKVEVLSYIYIFVVERGATKFRIVPRGIAETYCEGVALKPAGLNI